MSLQPAASTVPFGRTRPLALGLFVGVALTGLGWIAMLPPFEGFDETAHYSYVQQLWDTGGLTPEMFLSTDVQAYRATQPTPYGSIPPFEANRGVTYRAHRLNPEPAPKGAARRFAPSREMNWQSQHPPLYYLLMGPVYGATRDWGWPAHLLALRLVSWLMALAGLALGALATHRYARVLMPGAGGGAWPDLAGPLALAWPFFVPMFFPEMGRLGNDSLCLLIMGALWGQLLAMNARAGAAVDAVKLGLLLGLGLLTKALFVPVALAVIVLFAWQRRWGALAVTLAAAFLIVGPWYLHSWVTTGVPIGSTERRDDFGPAGGVARIVERFTVFAFARGLAAAGASFVWGGTWSLAKVPALAILPSVLLVATLALCGTTALKRGRAPLIGWFPVLVLLTFSAGLAAHILMRIGVTGAGVGTPGWYTHILAGPLGAWFALGLVETARGLRARRAVRGLAACSLVLMFVGSWLQFALYAGCAAKLGADDGYAFPDGMACAFDPLALSARVSGLAYPGAALPLLAAGLALGAWGVFGTLSRATSAAPAAPDSQGLMPPASARSRSVGID